MHTLRLALPLSVPTYGLILEAFRPFIASLPVSSKVKDIMKVHAYYITYWSALASLNAIFLWLVSIVLFGSMHTYIKFLASPSFRERFERHRAERRARRKQAGKPPRRVVFARISSVWLLCVALVINDTVFNRPKHVTSLMDGAFQRFRTLLEVMRSFSLVYVTLLAVAFFFHVAARRIQRIYHWTIATVVVFMRRLNMNREKSGFWRSHMET